MLRRFWSKHRTKRSKEDGPLRARSKEASGKAGAEHDVCTRPLSCSLPVEKTDDAVHRRDAPMALGDDRNDERANASADVKHGYELRSALRRGALGDARNDERGRQQAQVRAVLGMRRGLEAGAAGRRPPGTPPVGGSGPHASRSDRVAVPWARRGTATLAGRPGSGPLRPSLDLAGRTAGARPRAASDKL